jgi:hypothetical protein
MVLAAVAYFLVHGAFWLETTMPIAISVGRFLRPVDTIMVAAAVLLAITMGRARQQSIDLVLGVLFLLNFLVLAGPAAFLDPSIFTPYVGLALIALVAQACLGALLAFCVPAAFFLRWKHVRWILTAFILWFLIVVRIWTVQPNEPSFVKEYEDLRERALNTQVGAVQETHVKSDSEDEITIKATVYRYPTLGVYGLYFVALCYVWSVRKEQAAPQQGG